MQRKSISTSAITSVGVRALVEDNVEAMKTSLTFASRVAPSNEGATILTDVFEAQRLAITQTTPSGAVAV
jgi:hypothetical protein